VKLSKKQLCFPGILTQDGASGVTSETSPSNNSKIFSSARNILCLDRKRTEGETSSHPDNRAKAETGNLHTVGHIRCPACDSSKARAVRSVIDPKFDFTTAAVKWLEWHRPHIKERTASDYEQYILALERFGLGPSPLTEIHPGHFEQYQVWRKRNPKKGAGNPRINQELNCLKQNPRAIRPVGTHQAILQTAPDAQMETASGDVAREGR
jgi:hypothetical protein